MSRKTDQTDAKALEERYAGGRDVEPAPGLDRIIQARAEQAVSSGSRRQPARWLGGLATAAALVLAIGVVLQQGVFESDGLPAELREQVPAADRGSPAPAPAAESPASRPRPERSETRTAGEAPVLRRPAADSDQAVRLGREHRPEALFSEPSQADALADTASLDAESDEADELRVRAAEMDEQEVLDWIADLLQRGDLTRAGHLLHYLGERQAQEAERSAVRGGDAQP